MSEEEKLLMALTFLITQEKQAITDYNDVIKDITDKDVIKKLEEIKADEEEHLRELSNILMKI